MIENLNRLLVANLPSKSKIGHVRTTPRSVGCKITECCYGKAIEMVIGMCDEFVRFFCSSVEVCRCVCFVFNAEGDFFIEAVDRRGRGVDEFNGREEATYLENGDKAVKVGGDVVIGMGKGVANSCLSRKVGDMGNAMFQDEEFECVSILNVCRDDFNV